MEKFAIARKIPIDQYKNIVLNDIKYLRIEPNGNLFWSIHLKQATQFDHAEAEEKIAFCGANQLPQDCYLVPAIKTDA